MPASIDYLARETVSNLWRNKMMALAAILTIAISLALVGNALVLKQAVANQVGIWSGNINLAVFMEPSASPSQVAGVRSTISATPQIERCTYYGHQASFGLMKSLFKTDPEIASAFPRPSLVPTLFRCVLGNPGDAPAVASVLAHVPGILTTPPGVVYPAQQIRTMQSTTRIIQLILFIVALVLVLSSLVLILNAIRMAIFARRREIGVMKLVGATNWFIRVPFMLEGLVQGLIGAGVAAVIVLATNAGMRNVIGSTVTGLRGAEVSTGYLVVVEVVIVVIGAAVGAVGSAVAVRRFLEV